MAKKALINKAAANVGTTILPAGGLTGMSGAAGDEAMAALARDMNAGSVRVLFVRGANPVYALPKATQFAEGVARVPLKVSFSSYPDETSELCDVVLPDSHALESWGDSEASRGTLGMQQPVMDPVFNTRPTADVSPVSRGLVAFAPERAPRKTRAVAVNWPNSVDRTVARQTSWPEWGSVSKVVCNSKVPPRVRCSSRAILMRPSTVK